MYTSTFKSIIVKTSTNIKFEVPNLIRLTSLTGITGIIMGSVPQTSQLVIFKLIKGIKLLNRTSLTFIVIEVVFDTIFTARTDPAQAITPIKTTK